MMKSMCRRCSRTRLSILLFLLLGAIVNVAVAWGYALWSPQWCNFSAEEIDVPLVWPSYLEELSWPAPFIAYRYRLAEERGSVGLTFIDLIGDDPTASAMPSGPGSDRTFVTLMVLRFGLPFRALQWEAHVVRAGPRSVEMERAAASAAGWRTGIDVTGQLAPTSWESWEKERRLPLIPLWPGFAINTFLYAAPLWLVFLTPGMLRRWRGIRRIRRGQCPACAYPIGTSPVCTECGRELPEPRGVSTM